MFSGYTGVLLSATATPVWSQSRWLGPLFTASAISNGAAAISLVLELKPKEEPEAHKTLAKIDSAAHIAEAAALAGYVSSKGALAKPLTGGSMSACFWIAAAGIAVSELLKRPSPGKPGGRWKKLAAAAIGVASGFALKWAVQHAGAPSADDPDANRDATRRPQ